MKFVPLRFNNIEKLIDNFPHLTLIFSGHVVGICFFDIEIFSVNPKFCFFFSLFTMNMNWLISFVGINKESPSMNKQNCWHNKARFSAVTLPFHQLLHLLKSLLIPQY